MSKKRAPLSDSFVRTYPRPQYPFRVQVWDIDLHGFLLEVSFHSKRFIVRYKGRYKALGKWLE
jgi:hypothetical protein